MRIRAAFILVGIVSSLGSGRVAAQQPPAAGIAPLEEALAAMQASDAEIASIQRRIPDAEGRLKEVGQARLERARLERIEAVIAFATAVSDHAEQEGDASRYRATAIARLEGIPADVRRAYQDVADAVPEPKEGASAAEQAAVNARSAATAGQVDRLYGVSIAWLAASKAFDLDVSQEEAWLKQELANRAEMISVLLDIAIEEEAILAHQTSVLTDDAEIRARHAVADDWVNRVAGALESSVSMSKKLEIDTASYEQQLIAVTGEVKTADTRVIGGLLERWSAKLSASIAERGPGVLLSALLFTAIVFAFWKLAQIAHRVMDKALASANVQLSHLLKRMISATTRNAILVVGLLIALSQLGISLGPLLAGLGIAGFIVGFALQDALSNFASGIFILFYRPFDVDDEIEVAGCVGTVSKMSLVSTTILTIDNQTLVVPNSKIWGDVIKNVTAQEIRRVDLVFGISYGDDIEKAEKILSQLVTEHEKVLDDPAPVIRVHELGDSSVNFVCRPWVKTNDYWDVWWDLTKAVKLRFDAEGVSIPFPQRDVHIHAADRRPPTA